MQEPPPPTRPIQSPPKADAPKTDPTDPPPAAGAVLPAELAARLACPICLETLKQPVLTPCCHNTFCKPCLAASLKVGGSCPMCRSELQLREAMPNRALALLLPAQPAGAEAWGAEVGARAPADLRSYGLRCARASLLLFALFLLVWPAELLVRATGADLGLGPRGRPLLSAIEGWADLPSMRGWAPWVGQTVESGDGGRAAAEAAREARLPLMPQYGRFGNAAVSEAPASADDE